MQQKDYSKLRYGNITPSDIDGIIEYHDIAYIFYEFKLDTVEKISSGQQIAFERLTDDLSKIKPTLFIIATHDINDPSNDIPTHECQVEWYRRNGEWHKPETRISVKELTDTFIMEVNK